MNGNGMATEEPALRRAPTKRAPIPTYLLAALIALLAVCFIVLASVPPVDRDALTHHLAVPKLYLKHGGMVEIPSVPFSYYPMNLDLLYLFMLYFGNDIVPKYIHFVFAFLTAWQIYAYLHQRLEKPFWGLLGALMFLSLPVIVKLSVTVYVDLGLIFFSTASFLYLLKWAAGGYPKRHLILSGVFCGLAIGTKFNGLISLLLLASLIPILFVRGEKGLSPIPPQNGGGGPHRGGAGSPRALRAIFAAVLFSAVALLVYTPWMIRNAAWTGNPVFPMAVSLFGPNRAPEAHAAFSGKEAGGEIDQQQTQQDSGLGPFAIRKVIFGESLWEILAIPIRVFIQGRDDDPRFFDGRLNPYLLIFSLIAVLPLKGRQRPPRMRLEIRVMGFFALLYLFFAFFLVDMRIRYIGPIIPPLTILAVVGIQDLIGIIKARCSSRGQCLALSATGAVFLCLMGLNAAYLATQFVIIDPMSYLQGRLARDEYIQRYRPEYATLSFANKNLPEEARILALFNGNRIYYSERDMICDHELFRRAVSASQSPIDLVRRLERDRISHLLVRLDLFTDWADSQFKAGEKAVLQSFIREKLLLLYKGHGYALFAVTAG